MILKILFNFNLNASDKQDRFSKVLMEKDHKFALSKQNTIVIFNLSIVMRAIKVDLILVKKWYKKDILIICGSNYVKIIFALAIKIVTLYMQNF